MSVDWCDINGENAFSWFRLVALKTDWFAEERDHYYKKKKSEDTATVFSLVMAVSVGEPGKGYFHGRCSGTAPHGEM